MQDWQIGFGAARAASFLFLVASVSTILDFVVLGHVSDIGTLAGGAMATADVASEQWI
ncbi:hypothetical protein [Pelagibius litoralis]|uniref:hypothetical protein n=1 Tax=Pelagibius litoralis TaxID=374515 RepID=UPI0014240997|nr:hypothetical protein [Pelagibius litoralis]